MWTLAEHVDQLRHSIVSDMAARVTVRRVEQSIRAQVMPMLEARRCARCKVETRGRYVPTSVDFTESGGSLLGSIYVGLEAS